MAVAATLAAGINHEVRQPLNLIRIAIDELRDRLPAVDDDVRELLADVDDAIEHIATIAQDLVMLARRADEVVDAADLEQVVANAARLAVHRRGAPVRLDVAPLANLRVAGSASRLVQIVRNLLDNAVNATAPGRPNDVRVSARADGERVVLVIADAGTGMPPDTLARAFEPFFTTRGARGGTGLGLSICRALVEGMGGSIAIRSTLGAGTTVEVTLRRATSA